MTTHATAGTARPVVSTIPARLDRLRWSPFHTRMVIGLGTAWILDGLEITVASSVTSLLTHSDTLALTTSEVSSLATVYLVGQVVGALVFGKLSDSLGRRRLFMWTLAIYLVGTGLSAAAWPGTAGLIYLYLTRFVAGSGIGGEYAAINSAIDEMMPARYRGRTDIWINGTYWAGSVIGTFASFLLINAFAPDTGWRLAFLVGPVLAVVVLLVRRNLPESPRWLLTHGREGEALAAMEKIEQSARDDGQHLAPEDARDAITLLPERITGT
jgi:MFS family permease